MNEFIPLENKLNIAFRDKLLLKQAFVHSSYTNEHLEWALPSNERLEFLGDAFLNLIIARELYLRHPFFDEGSLTNVRARVVCTEALTRQAKILGLGSILWLGK
ncbi:ribonuclease III domain-containing protein, partial [Chloroflexota bacterium]